MKVELACFDNESILWITGLIWKNGGKKKGEKQDRCQVRFSWLAQSRIIRICQWQEERIAGCTKVFFFDGKLAAVSRNLNMYALLWSVLSVSGLECIRATALSREWNNLMRVVSSYVLALPGYFESSLSV